MGKWKISLGAIIVVVVIALVAVFGLNRNPSPGTQGADTGQTNQSSQTNEAGGTSGTSQSQQSPVKVVDPNAAKYEGQDNLAKFEAAAKQKPNDASAQADAATSAFVNGVYSDAAAYYKKAVALQPKNAQYLTALGNVYFRGLNDANQAKSYYTAATQADPKYAYGWLNLALCDVSLGNKAEAKSVLQKGAASVDPSDETLKAIQQELESLK